MVVVVVWGRCGGGEMQLVQMAPFGTWDTRHRVCLRDVAQIKRGNLSRLLETFVSLS